MRAPGIATYRGDDVGCGMELASARARAPTIINKI